MEPVVRCALNGDIGAWGACLDWIAEHEGNMTPFEIGEKYLICTVTLYYVGEIVEATMGWLRIKDASWVHWTGKLSDLLREYEFKTARSPRPRVERCGDVIISCGSIVSAYPWRGSLPKESVQ